MSIDPNAPRSGSVSPAPLQMILAFSKASLGSASTLVAMALLTKVIAVIGGPATLGLFSMLRQTELTGVAIASSDGDRALVQGISAGLRNGTISRYVWNIGALMAAITLFEAGLLWLLAPWLSEAIFRSQSPELVWALRLVSVPVFLAVGATWLVAVLKAHLAVGRAVLVRTIAASVGVAAAILAARHGSPLAMLLILIAVEATAAVAAWSLVRSIRVLPPAPTWTWSAALADGRTYLSVAGYLLLTGISRNIGVMVVRIMFLRTLGLAYAGFFEAAWTVAGKSLLFLLDAIGTYYLPLLSAARDSRERPQLLRRLTRLAWVTGSLAVTGLIVLKPLAIELLYAGEFLQSIIILQWMVIGVYFQSSSWPFSTAMLAFGDARHLFRVDLAWMALFAGGSTLALLVWHSPEGVGISYLVASVLALGLTAAHNVRRYEVRLKPRMIATWALGLMLVLGASWTTWGKTEVSWPLAGAWIAQAAWVSLLALRPEERRAVLATLTRRGPPS